MQVVLVGSREGRVCRLPLKRSNVYQEEPALLLATKADLGPVLAYGEPTNPWSHSPQLETCDLDWVQRINLNLDASGSGEVDRARL